MKRLFVLMVCVAIAAPLRADDPQPVPSRTDDSSSMSGRYRPMENSGAVPPDAAASPVPWNPPMPEGPRLPAAARDQLRNHLDASHPVEHAPVSPVVSFFAAESLFALNSYLASLAPQIYGAAGTILLPAGVAGLEPGPERTLSVVMLEGLALYNLLGVDDDKMSEGEIFRANFAIWNGILLVNTLVSRTSVKRSEERKKIVILPTRGGAEIRTAWRFR